MVFLKLLNSKILMKNHQKRKKEFSKKTLRELKNLTNSKIGFNYRGVEQPGSSQGS